MNTWSASVSPAGAPYDPPRLREKWIDSTHALLTTTVRLDRHWFHNIHYANQPHSVMTGKPAPSMPSPLPPTDAELASWNALTRDEQLARSREYLARPDCDRVSHATLADISTDALARVAGLRIA
jgi:hypothetical protein